MYRDIDEKGENGHFMLAIDIARWMPVETFGERMENLCQWLIPQDAPEGARLPGDARWSEIERSLSDGVLVEDGTLGAIEKLADELGLEPAWSH